ncbi:hypothetical protein SAMN05216378_3784 [Paenibacillus catalpae]|uniref:Uncharacterized protein n=1 Tax=Paenibacillus catalpae TaxID=1045775 RepID=A0A1I2C383_9BACL|nr:hypothetical protein SAMN05216378_3784 [Paenibacillus catalpae]
MSNMAGKAEQGDSKGDSTTAVALYRPYKFYNTSPRDFVFVNLDTAESSDNNPYMWRNRVLIAIYNVTHYKCPRQQHLYNQSRIYSGFFYFLYRSSCRQLKTRTSIQSRI